MVLNKSAPASKDSDQSCKIEGFGIVELLVAATIVSIIAAAGFSLFLNIQQSVFDVKKSSKEVVEARGAADRLWLELQSDSSFFTVARIDYPPDGSSTVNDNETKLPL